MLKLLKNVLSVLKDFLFFLGCLFLIVHGAVGDIFAQFLIVQSIIVALMAGFILTETEKEQNK